MFKIGELQNTNNEKIIIEKHQVESYDVNTKKTTYCNTLSFLISGIIENKEFSYYFELDEDINNLLKFNKLEKINVNNKVTDIMFNLNDKNAIEPNINNIYFTKYINNKFNVVIYFIAENFENNIIEDKYSGVIEFDFDLDNYIGEKNEIN